MANHVDNSISIEEQAESTKVTTLWEPLLKLENCHEFPFYTDYEEDNWYSWGIDNVGAKWANIEYIDDGFINICSAWSPVTPFTNKLVEWLGKADDAVVIRHNYTDEFYNFIGVSKFTFEEGMPIESNDEMEWDEILDILKEKYGFDATEEDFDWWDTHDDDEGHSYNELLEYEVENQLDIMWGELI